MVLSDVSVKRPVFATVVSLLIVVFGISALMKFTNLIPQTLNSSPVVCIVAFKGYGFPIPRTSTMFSLFSGFGLLTISFKTCKLSAPDLTTTSVIRFNACCDSLCLNNSFFCCSRRNVCSRWVC